MIAAGKVAFSKFVARIRRAPTRWGLGALVVVAVGLRLAAIFVLFEADAEHVAYEHGEIAENLVAGRGFSVRFLGAEGPTSQQSPVYPTMLAGAYLLFGVGSGAAHLSVMLVQAAVGAVAVVATAVLFWSLVPSARWLGWGAAWIAAVHPVHVYMVTQLQVVVWVSCLLLTTLAAAVSARRSGSWRIVCMAGALGGVLILFEPIMLLAVGVAWIATIMPREGFALRLGPAAVLAATVAIVVAPWIVRNYRVHDEFVLVKSTLGYAFWQGNHPASWGTDKIPKPSAETLRLAHDGTLAGRHRALWEARHETLYIDDVVLTEDDYVLLSRRSEPERARILGRRAMRFVQDDPARYAGLCAARLRYFLLFDATNPKAHSAPYRVTTVTCLLLGFVGFLASRPYWRPMWPALCVAALVGGFHVLTIYSARFRIPLEPLLFPWVAAAVVPPVARIWRRRRGTEASEGSEPAILLPHPSGQAESGRGPERRGRAA